MCSPAGAGTTSAAGKRDRSESGNIARTTDPFTPASGYDSMPKGSVAR